MRNFSNNCLDEVEITSNFSSVIVEDKEDCGLSISLSDLKTWSKFLLKVSAVSAFAITSCNKGYNSSNHHYSKVIGYQHNNLIGANDYLESIPIVDDIDPEHEIAYITSQLEDLNPIPPKKSFKVKGRVVSIQKGSISTI